jgi:hypothetical protein
MTVVANPVHTLSQEIQRNFICIFWVKKNPQQLKFFIRASMMWNKLYIIHFQWDEYYVYLIFTQKRQIISPIL